MGKTSILNPGQDQIAYTLDGPADAPVLVLSNSLGTTMRMWNSQIDALSRRYRVLRYDTRGHGGSGVGADTGDGYTLDQLGGDVVRLLDGLGIERASFCGISMGGLTGLWLGVHAADRIQRLVVANSAARIGSATGWTERANLVMSSGMDGVAEGARGRWFTDAFCRRSPALTDVLIDELRLCPPAGYAACCLALAAADLRDDIRAIRVPTLLIAGRHDPVTTVADGEFMRERIAGSRLAVVDGSHLSNVEDADNFTGLLRTFLG